MTVQSKFSVFLYCILLYNLLLAASNKSRSYQELRPPIDLLKTGILPLLGSISYLGAAWGNT